MNKVIIAITMGDPAGVGAEIAVKAMGRKELYTHSIPIIIGSKAVIKDAISFIPSNLKLNIIKKPEDALGEFGTIDILDLDNIQLDYFKYGEVSLAAGKAAIEYILKAIDLSLEDRIQAVVTGPINKEAINKAGYHYAGHTELFAEKTSTNNYAMMLSSKNMRVIHVSTHVSLKEAVERVKEKRIYDVICLANKAMLDIGIEKPKIAVAGLNPHSGENGLFGREEIEEIIPAIKKVQKEGINVEGPIPPDTVFSKVMGGRYDIAVVMYHDQGHIPMKVTGFKLDKKTNEWKSVSGVNTTVGLPIIRTSVDHGTAFDIAGENEANEDSLVEALELAVEFVI
ncbi:4-hydroxythreonine-4-phosphate dehydrogenase [Halanaerobium congolense]|jgi:4-hydroxythreonine-4-phosphate dehydrogenase|uniref:4-hydroxythreonine-4-phosphate dehydrogenase n=1 Tax=Halanaerobium congolense TaxID=54121 RepID=A0A1G6T242_9FIRM|nr:MULTISPECIES: 4-hydroxythreonine-4-phosphate dehydrogenase PdxA [Halanaerobium]PTX17319.1 4-hydroxythreonine-4-phosphate dehydrogenase [Halanaerobium congolense]PUU87510.1 MAG: 4-hydroxythreonine-4-phosphate dehydrogenase [Halanaerobium sp.]TDX45439.1 4-hydroxythreonine-4-phosphate dehydrogenase [Halanaerobium congolense]SDD23202.1 4-hydroxythreonine-4-phosphate dehydrogenase [Halanaerobium congolense]SDG21549.1 4-hydroxythreonine-4-phosphate dehydrogenase [Halanaerobium congolense]